MRKDPTLACLLNLLLLGTGHIYLGQVGKGLLILAVGIALGMILWPATILVAVWAMFDAYNTAKKMNQSLRKNVVDRTKQVERG